jgi:hypothetical protein
MLIVATPCRHGNGEEPNNQTTCQFDVRDKDVTDMKPNWVNVLADGVWLDRKGLNQALGIRGEGVAIVEVGICIPPYQIWSELSLEIYKVIQFSTHV